MRTSLVNTGRQILWLIQHVSIFIFGSLQSIKPSSVLSPILTAMAALIISGCGSSSSSKPVTELADNPENQQPGGQPPANRLPDIPGKIIETVASFSSACGEFTLAENSPSVPADYFNQKTNLVDQLELLTLSTLPDTVTGGDVLVAVRGLSDISANCLSVVAIADNQSLYQSDNLLASKANAMNVESATEIETDSVKAMVAGLAEGTNQLVAHLRLTDGSEKQLVLAIQNHPITGPVISGPHQTPYVCRTEENGLGAPLDEHCSVETVFQWFYKRQRDQAFVELDDPFAAYPNDIMFTQIDGGAQVPFVVRVESNTINRGITRIAVLDDPAARGREAPFTPNWNQRALLSYGESCGVGYHQGKNNVNSVLGSPAKIISDSVESQSIDTSAALAPLIGISDMLGRGYAIIHSTNTTLGVHCNDMLSGETTMMIKEHMIEQYGELDRFLSAGGSGGAIQQLTTANNFPGLLDGLTPLIEFPDVITTAMTAADCGLLANYFANSDLEWSEQEIAAVSGHIGTNICNDWNSLFTPHIQADRNCDGSVSRGAEQGIYNAADNPDGVRCTLQDATKNLWGVFAEGHPDAGKVRRPLDNQGIQYGLRALLDGEISSEKFVDLNRNIGGFDLDGGFINKRMVMPEDVARVAYQTGRVSGRGSLHQVPMIDLNLYLDPIPVLGFHDQVRSYMTRERLRRTGEIGTQSIWNGVPSHVEAYVRLNEWLDAAALDDLPAEERQTRLISQRPLLAGDLCTVNPIGPNLNPQQGVTLPLGFESGVIPTLQEALPSVDIPLALSVPIAQNHRLSPDYDTMDALNPCENIFPALRSTRIQAGGPLSEDIIKCQLMSPMSEDYNGLLNEAQLEQMNEVFTEGVCDWSKPSIGDNGDSLVWATIGGETLIKDEEGRLAPQSLVWRVAVDR